MESKEVIWEAAKPHIKGLAEVIAEKVIVSSLDKVIADSANKIDDGVWAMIKPMLISEMQKQIGQI